MPRSRMDIKLENWQNKLLDLGKRNKLLNYKDTTKSSLRITAPSFSALYKTLVADENSLPFPRPEIDTQNEGSLTQARPVKSEANSDEHPADFGGRGSVIRTNKTLPDLQKVLRNLRNKARIAVEEQGINILYLSFGFLNWTEAAHSSVRFSSPLILVPVTLTVESITAPFVLSRHEDEIVVNPTLAYKLSSDYGITLPDFDEADSPDQYISQVQTLVKNQGWTVDDSVGMSLLSFLKINMYDDLKKHHDTIVANPVVRALAGDSTALKRIPDALSDYDFDKNDRPQDVFQIVDADASQQEAILLAKKGYSFILQGPPGTGKSQTITNIIAECLADGKKVLFVAEKMAALEVVHRRLASAGLSDFCLVLHSHKTSKRGVLDQLDSVLTLAHQKHRLSDEAYRQLDNLQHDKQKLNDYAAQIYSVVQPLGKTIYEVNGIISNLQAYEDVVFPLSGVRETSGEQLNNYLYLLEQLKTTIEKSSCDYKSNPWRGAALSAVTNEFRHDANAQFSVFLPKLKEVSARVQAIFEETNCEYPKTMLGVDRLAAVLQTLRSSYEVPVEWITCSSLLPLQNQIFRYSQAQQKCQEYVKDISSRISQLTACGILKSIDEHDLFEIETQDDLLDKIDSELNYAVPFYRWINSDINDVIHVFNEAKAQAAAIRETKEEIEETYEEGIYSIDYTGILNRFKTEYTSFFKVFKGSYQQDKKSFLLHSKQVGRKITDEDMLKAIDSLQKLDELKKWYHDNEIKLNSYFANDIESENGNFAVVEEKLKAYRLLREARSLLNALHNTSKQFAAEEPDIRQNFGPLYAGIFTDWEDVQHAWDWTALFRKAVATDPPSRLFVEQVCTSKPYAENCFRLLSVLVEAKRGIETDLKWYSDCFGDPAKFYSMNLDDLYERVSACKNGFSLLEDWIDYRTARINCLVSGLSGYLNAIEENDLDARDIVPVFKKRFYRLWLDAVLPEYPAVLAFRSKQQANTIEEFARLDKAQFDIARARIRSKLINALPSMDHFTTGVDEMSILKRELAKQRRIMPIRKLFREIPNLLLTLKPCLMMSPLSVSLFLEAESYQFDIVIFDEASQVFTENAVGAIARGKQVVIAGDSKQLPPTNFFQVSAGDNGYDYDDADEEEDSEVYDSIIDEANMLPDCFLRWHYRSRHEGLIAFSNAKIYRNKLVTFPSNTETGINSGVEYIHVPGGFYDRGGKKGNVAEAQKVAELVFEHIRTLPNRSLGVIAFGEVQQTAIETALREYRLANQEYEDFFSEDKEEPFFVKSLENVQGDERDTIIFSIGYAPDASGVFRMNFGPLGKTGGERRLNVAITRAKYNVKLVGSILPTDINLDSITTEGPKLLRAYMDYAINGPSVIDREILESDIVEHDSPFEEAVFNYLDKKGYKLATQVGCSGFRIDIGVKHPKISGVYVLGIECDGASYHSARTARERDRLRQDVLENMGWTIYRVWSTDWIKDPITEGEKLVRAIENAIATYGHERMTEDSSPSGTTPTDYVQVEIRATPGSSNGNPYGFPHFKETSFDRLPKDRYGNLILSSCIEEVIRNEYPIHYDMLCQRVAGVLGNEKATVRVRREVDSALNYVHNYVQKGDFFFLKGYKTIPARVPNKRDIQYIHEEELSSAMLTILRSLVGPTRKALIDETARVYGFSRTGPQISQAMNGALESLLKRKEIIELEGKLRLP